MSSVHSGGISSSTPPSRRPRSSAKTKREAAKESADRSRKLRALPTRQGRTTPPPSTPTTRRQTRAACPPTPVTPSPIRRRGAAPAATTVITPSSTQPRLDPLQPTTLAGPSTSTNRRPGGDPPPAPPTPSSTNGPAAVRPSGAAEATEADEGARRTPVVRRTYLYNRTMRMERTPSVCTVPSVLSNASSLPSVLGAVVGSKASDKEVRDKLIQVFITNGICQMCQCISWNLSSLPCGHSFCSSCLSTAFKGELQSNLNTLRYDYHYGHPIEHCTQVPTNVFQFARTIAAIERHGLEPQGIFSYRCWCCRRAVKTAPVPNYSIRGMLSDLYQVIKRDLFDLGYSRLADECGPRPFDLLFVHNNV